MVIHNKKAIGFIIIIVGLGIMLFWGNILVKMLSLPFTGSVADAKVIGFKTKGSKHIVKNNNSGVSGRSPFFEFISDKNDTIKANSNAPQIFVLFNYQIGESINVGFPKNEPNKAIILSWKEYPGLILMMAMGVLCLFVGKSFLTN